MTNTLRNFLLFSAFTLVLGSCGSELVDVQEFGVMAKNTRQLATDVTTDVYSSCLRNEEYQAKYEARQRELISKLPPGLNEPSSPLNKPPNQESPRKGELDRRRVPFNEPLTPQNPSRPPEVLIGPDGTQVIPSEPQTPSQPPGVIIGPDGATVVQGSSSLNKPPNQEFPRKDELDRPPVLFKPPLTPQNPSRPPVGFRPSLGDTHSSTPEAIIGPDGTQVILAEPTDPKPNRTIPADETKPTELIRQRIDSDRGGIFTFAPIKLKYTCQTERENANVLRFAVETLAVYGETLVLLASGNEKIVEQTMTSSVDTIQQSLDVLGKLGVAAEQLVPFTRIGNLAVTILSPILESIATQEKLSNVRPIIVCRNDDIQKLVEILNASLGDYYLLGMLQREEDTVDLYYETTYRMYQMLGLTGGLTGGLATEADLLVSYNQNMEFFQEKITNTKRLQAMLSQLAFEHNRIANSLTSNMTTEEVKKFCQDYDNRIMGKKSFVKNNPLLKELTLKEKAEVLSILQNMLTEMKPLYK
jgi:hypothetical protein